MTLTLFEEVQKLSPQVIADAHQLMLNKGLSGNLEGESNNLSEVTWDFVVVYESIRYTTGISTIIDFWAC